ncbi:MAG: alpha/beta fold hydrolase [bacterium]
MHQRISQGQHCFQVMAGGQPLAVVLQTPQGWPEVPCVVLCHGLLSSMESPKFKALAEALNQEGLAALLLDFRGCGKSGGSLKESTVSARVEDLSTATRFLAQSLEHKGPLGLMGSSMGGFVALLYAGMGKAVAAISVWAAPFDPLELEDLRTHPQTAQLGNSFFQDLRSHDLSKIKGKIKNLLVIHGEKDELIPISHAKRIYQLGCAPRQMYLIAQADHRFTHPAHRQEAISLTVKWFLRHMR